MSCQLWALWLLYARIWLFSRPGFLTEDLATLLYAWLSGPVSLRVQHGFQLFQFGVTSLNSEPQQTHQTVTNTLSRLPSPQLSDLARSHVVTCDKQKQEQKEGNSMLAHILSFFLRKIHPASLSIMQEHNFEHNARILGLTLKSIMLKFSSIIYLTLTSRG